VLNNLENVILRTWTVRSADNNSRRRQLRRRVRTADTVRLEEEEEEAVQPSSNEWGKSAA
jgi:hypothetical protein